MFILDESEINKIVGKKNVAIKQLEKVAKMIEDLQMHNLDGWVIVKKIRAELETIKEQRFH